MGFSLGRALAGALAGGAAAAGQVADQQILEATRQREADAQLARQRQLMIEQDELLANRAERVAATKNAYDEAKIGKVADFMKSGLTTLKADKIDPGSIVGQQRLAAMATENGHPELGDKFFDNAIKLGQIKSTEELRREEMKTRLITVGLAREAAADNKASARELRDEQFNQNKIANMANIDYTEKDGTKQKINAYGQFNTLFQEAKDTFHTPAQALEAVSVASSLTGQAIRSGVNPDQALNAAINRAATWRKPAEPAAPQAPIQVAAPAQPKAVIPGLLSRREPRDVPENFDFSMGGVPQTDIQNPVQPQF